MPKRLLFRNRELDAGYVEGVKEKIRAFLDSAALEESALIFDGPGLGCPSSALALPLLGMERLKRFKDIHCFSASGYSLFWYHAWSLGQMKYTPETIMSWNRDNQSAHGIRYPFIHIPQALFRKFARTKYLFGHETRRAIDSTVSESYASQPIRNLPPNFNFWAHQESEKKLYVFNAECSLNELSPAQVMCAAAAIPHIYQPLVHQGQTFSDALFFPGIRQHYRELASRYRHVLFIHMQHDGERGKVRFIKAHPHGSGYLRVAVDYLYFISGLENREFQDGMHRFLTLPKL